MQWLDDYKLGRQARKNVRDILSMTIEKAIMHLLSKQMTDRIAKYLKTPDGVFAFTDMCFIGTEKNRLKTFLIYNLTIEEDFDPLMLFLALLVYLRMVDAQNQSD